jgi:hypothetical protein
MRKRQVLVGTWLLGRSLGVNGCGVKDVSLDFTCSYILYWVIV